MSPDEQHRAIVEAVTGAEQLLIQLAHSRVALSAVFPLSPSHFDEITAQEWDALYAFQMKFLLLQDLTSRRLVRGFLALSGEDPRDFSMREAVDRVAELGGLVSGDDWLDLSLVRNMLAHDYPVDLAQFADRLSQAWERYDALIDNVRCIIATLRRKELV